MSLVAQSVPFVGYFLNISHKRRLDDDNGIQKDGKIIIKNGKCQLNAVDLK
jgi:hypothetical protein